VHKLKSRYDFVERKDKLGDQQNESIETNLVQFREDLTQLISTRSINARNVLQSVYVAYALSLGEDLNRKKLFLHQLHHIWRLDDFLKDFPDSQILAITRDPRASYVSGYEHHARFDPTKDTADRVFSVLKRVVEDATPLEKYGSAYVVVRLEDLHDVEKKERVSHQLCEWLGIGFHPCMRKSSWGGLRWWGDRLSRPVYDGSEEEFERSITRNSWETKLGWADKYLFEFLLGDRLRYYNYPFMPRNRMWDYVIAFCAIPFPNIYEKRFLFPFSMWRIGEKESMGKKVRKVLLAGYYYVRRVSFYYRLYCRKVAGRHFRSRLLNVAEQSEIGE